MQPIVHALRSPFTPLLLIITLLSGLVVSLVILRPAPRPSVVIITTAPAAPAPAPSPVVTQVMTPDYRWCEATNAGCGIWNANYWRPMPACWYTARGCH